MPENLHQPNRSPSHRRHRLNESTTLYNYIPLEMWAGSQAEWSSLIRTEALGEDKLETQIAPPDPKSMLVTLGFAISLLSLCALTLIWNASRLTKAVAQGDENTVQEVASPNR